MKNVDKLDNCTYCQIEKEKGQSLYEMVNNVENKKYNIDNNVIPNNYFEDLENDSEKGVINITKLHTKHNFKNTNHLLYKLNNDSMIKLSEIAKYVSNNTYDYLVDVKRHILEIASASDKSLLEFVLSMEKSINIFIEGNVALYGKITINYQIKDGQVIVTSPKNDKNRGIYFGDGDNNNCQNPCDITSQLTPILLNANYGNQMKINNHNLGITNDKEQPISLSDTLVNINYLDNFQRLYNSVLKDDIIKHLYILGYSNMQTMNIYVYSNTYYFTFTTKKSNKTISLSISDNIVNYKDVFVYDKDKQLEEYRKLICDSEPSNIALRKHIDYKVDNFYNGIIGKMLSMVFKNFDSKLSHIKYSKFVESLEQIKDIK